MKREKPEIMKWTIGALSALIVMGCANRESVDGRYEGYLTVQGSSPVFVEMEIRGDDGSSIESSRISASIRTGSNSNNSYNYGPTNNVAANIGSLRADGRSDESSGNYELAIFDADVTIDQTGAQQAGLALYCNDLRFRGDIEIEDAYRLEGTLRPTTAPTTNTNNNFANNGCGNTTIRFSLENRDYNRDR